MSKEGLNFSVSEFPICKSFRIVPNLATAEEMLLISGDMSGIQDFIMAVCGCFCLTALTDR
jgi:CRISPR/Cas system-associated protein Cas10 (large subunit of type III CRISPR-Cas system)